ncbi:hypothetical protein FRIGORI9N_90057 [Frigoribacterium sp. 9N]|nr:hypothetical protein FRIGORI9N_90057 [Frigoribacterium sp. 9N]
MAPHGRDRPRHPLVGSLAGRPPRWRSARHRRDPLRRRGPGRERVPHLRRRPRPARALGLRRDGRAARGRGGLHDRRSGIRVHHAHRGHPERRRRTLGARAAVARPGLRRAVARAVDLADRRLLVGSASRLLVLFVHVSQRPTGRAQ